MLNDGEEEQDGVKHSGVEAAKADATTYADHGDYVSFQTSFAAEGIFTAGDGDDGYRSPDKVKKMAPFCNGMRVVINHPDVAPEALTCADLNDKKFPVIGWTSDARAIKSGGYWKVVGLTNIYKNRNGINAAKVIAKLRTGDMGDVSIGYFFARVPKKGTVDGRKYGHLEVDVNPYHLAILDGPEPACPQPICGVGCASKQVPLKEDEDMEGNKNDTSGKTPQEHAPASTTAPECAGCKAHAENQAKTVVAETEALRKRVVELEKTVNDQAPKIKEGEEAKAKIEAIKVAERKARVDKLKELMDEEQFKELFPEDAKDTSDAEIARFLKVLETRDAEPEATPPEAEPETAAAKPAADPALKAPAGKTVPASPGKNEDDAWLPDMYMLSKKRLAEKAAAKRA
jgi:hypothetical protein